MPHIKGKTDIEWHYDAEGEGKNLVFLHGWGVDKRIWRQQAKHFEEKYRVITVDLPGHGKSTWQRMSFDELCADLNQALIQLIPDTMTVVGSSLGGLFGLRIYEGLPEKIERMVLVGSMPRFAKSEDYPHGLDIAQLKKLEGQLERDYPMIIDVFFRSLFTPEERRSRRYKWLQKFRAFNEKPMKSALAEYLDILEEVDLRFIMQKLKIPVQFIAGRGDEICTPEVVEDIKELIPHARFDYFEECGHFPFLSKPYEFNQVVESFLEESIG